MANGFFSEEKVAEVRDRSSILEVVSDYVSLKKTGRNYKGLCPFHSEKTPSFMVNEEKQIFHCFGCGEGGNVFTFLIKVAHFSFPQAVEELAKRYGVPLPSRERSPTQKKEFDKREILFQINQIAMEYFHDLLLHRREGETARKYLSQRGVSEAVLAEHRLGYAADRWEGLVQHLQSRKVQSELARELGLILPKKKEGWYDAFRGRIIFPIFDIHRRVIGFGGRVLGEGQPKYLNSPESSIYRKGETLYGLQVAKQHIPEKDKGIIVEGYFDLLTLHQYGFQNSVATLGTALTAQHIRILKRYTMQLITVFDADRAGVQANLRALPLLLEEEVWGKTILLPKGEDPDTFLRKGSVEDFKKRVDEATPLFDFFFDNLMKTYDVKSMDGRAKIAEEGLALVRKVPEGIRRNFYIKELSEKVNLQETALHELLHSPSHHRPKEGEALKGQGPEKRFPKPEEMVIRLMVQSPGLIPRIAQEGILQEFDDPLLRKMGEELKVLYQNKGRLDLGEAFEELGEDLKGLLGAFTFQGDGLEGENLQKVVEDCIERIHERRLKKDRVDLLRKIKEAEKQKEQKGLEALLLEHQRLVKREKVHRKTNL